MLDVKKIYSIDFKGICMNFLLTSKQPHKIVEILLGHPVKLPCLLIWPKIQPKTPAGLLSITVL
jgi:hypothetical protein